MGSTIPSGSVSSAVRLVEENSFGDGVAGCLEAPSGFVRVAFAVGGVEELTWGWWLVVMDGNVSCYGGQPIVLPLLVFFFCLAGPGASALALYSVHAWNFGM